MASEIREVREALMHGRTRFKSGVGTVTVSDPTAHAELLKLPKVYARDLDTLRIAVERGPCKRKGTLGVATLKRRLTVARMIFADQRRDCRRALKAPPQRLLRERARQRGKQLYSAADIRNLAEAANLHLKAMILLEINCGIGPKDCCTLPASELEDGWHNFARPKTGVE